MRHLVVATALLLVAPAPVRAQWLSLATRAPVSAAPPANTSGAFALEAGAGVLGSLAGMAIVGLSGECGTDDLECLIRKVGGGGILGAVGATVGTSLAARATGSDRSLPGAALGAVLGTAVGLGVHYLANSNSDRNFDDPIYIVPIFAISQGVVAALGSRLLSR